MDDITKKFFTRNELVLGQNQLEKIRNSRVAIFGIGGVGSVVCEQLIRLGVRKILFFARGHYDFGNINRQIPATYLNIKSKTKKIHALSQRLLEINPFIEIINLDGDIITNIDEIKEILSRHSTELVFNCVDEYNAQHIVAKCSSNLGIPFFIGGVTGIGDKGIVTLFKDDELYKEYFTYNNKSSAFSDIEIKKEWLEANSIGLDADVIAKYSIDEKTPYPVITPIPWIIASTIITEFIKYKLDINTIVTAPQYIFINSFENETKIDYLTTACNSNYFPWRP